MHQVFNEDGSILELGKMGDIIQYKYKSQDAIFHYNEKFKIVWNDLDVERITQLAIFSIEELYEKNSGYGKTTYNCFLGRNYHFDNVISHWVNLTNLTKLKKINYKFLINA